MKRKRKVTFIFLSILILITGASLWLRIPQQILSDLYERTPLYTMELIKYIEEGKRGKYIFELGYTKDPRAFEPLVKLLFETKDLHEKADVVFALQLLGDKRAIPILKTTLKDDGEYVRLRSAIALFELGDESAESILLALIKEGETEALTTLCFSDMNKRILRNERSKPLLIEALNCPYEWTRVSAAFYLAEMGEKELVYPVAIDILKNSKYPTPRSSAVSILRMVGDEKSVMAIREAALNDKDKEVITSAFVALSKLNRKDIIKEIMEKEFQEEMRRRAERENEAP